MNYARVNRNLPLLAVKFKTVKCKIVWLMMMIMMTKMIFM
jgi:hypothetical protein